MKRKSLLLMLPLMALTFSCASYGSKITLEEATEVYTDISKHTLDWSEVEKFTMKSSGASDALVTGDKEKGFIYTESPESTAYIFLAEIDGEEKIVTTNGDTYTVTGAGSEWDAGFASIVNTSLATFQALGLTAMGAAILGGGLSEDAVTFYSKGDGSLTAKMLIEEAETVVSFDDYRVVEFSGEDEEGNDMVVSISYDKCSAKAPKLSDYKAA